MTAPPARDRRSIRLFGLAIFTAALATRLLFWLGTPDRTWGWTAYFKGDAPLWLDWARALEIGSPFELGLPIHPPGAAYLVSLLWSGQPSGIPFLRFAWVVIGALVPLLVFFAAERPFGLRVAAVAGCWTAISTGLVVLSTSINNETPYLALAIGAIWFVEDLRARPTPGRLAAWAALNGLACLFRVEHLLFFVVVLAFLAIGWARTGGSRPLKSVMLSLLFFVLPLAPWHLSAWGAIQRFNQEPRALTPVEESAVAGVERATSDIPWNGEAQRRGEELPGFLRRTASAFVVATVAHRGGREVRGEDFRILEEAFGYFPRPLGRRPFVSSYGPLNFYLANNPEASGGFVRSPLARPPPLEGGAALYPPALVAGLPPGDLSFVYPPHLRLFNEGYSIGWGWIRENPGDFARLAIRKLSTFWSGAAMGFTGWNVPLGLSGPRGAVDMVTPERRPIAIAWRLALLAVAVAGIVALRRRPAIVPWLAFLASKVVVTVAFFGYARQGALAIPVLALLAALAVERWPISRALSRVPTARFTIVLLLLGVGAEAARVASRPEVRIDGLPAGRVDPIPSDDHRARRIEVE